jgi:chemotaxis protein MotB
MWMKKDGMMKNLICGLLCSALWLPAGCGVPQEQYEADLASLRRVIDETRAGNDALQNDADILRRERDALSEEIDALESQLRLMSVERDANADAVEQARARIAMFRDMLIQFKAMSDSGKARIKIENNKMVVQLASAILFASGSDRLSREGKEALAEVAEILSGIEGRAFQVAGHTDNKPIGDADFDSNWELSAARAVAVVAHLIECGMPARTLSAAGYADTQPVSSNETNEGRAENRRIEIVMQPNLDELPDLSSLETMLD